MTNVLAAVAITGVVSFFVTYLAYKRGFRDGRSAGLTEQEFRELSRR